MTELHWGKNFSGLLSAAGLTQTDLAAKCGVAASTINRWTERDVPPNQRRNAHQLKKAAAALNVALEAIAPEARKHLGGAEESEPRTADTHFWTVCFNHNCLTYKGDNYRDPYLWRQLPNSSRDEVNFCGSCGEKLASSCDACGHPMGEGHRYCVKCGRPHDNRVRLRLGWDKRNWDEFTSDAREKIPGWLEGVVTEVKRQLRASDWDDPSPGGGYGGGYRRGPETTPVAAAADEDIPF